MDPFIQSLSYPIVFYGIDMNESSQGPKLTSRDPSIH